MAPRKGKISRENEGARALVTCWWRSHHCFRPPSRVRAYTSRVCVCVCVCVCVFFFCVSVSRTPAPTKPAGCKLAAACGNGPAGRSKSVHHSRREKIIRGHVYSENKKKRLQICAPFRPFVPSMVVFAVGRPAQGGCTPRVDFDLPQSHRESHCVPRERSNSTSPARPCTSTSWSTLLSLRVEQPSHNRG